MKAIDWILRCYPPRWRERYQEEITALLEQHTITSKTLLDLLLGALDARLDPTYRSKDGFMFQNIRDVRSLSILYVCALTVFLFSVTFSLTLSSSLGFQDNAIGATTNALGSNRVFIVSLMILIALLCITYGELKKTFQNRRWGVLIFALLCLGLAIALFSISITFPLTLDFSSFVYIPDLLIAIEMALLLGAGLFVIGVKGISLLRNRQGRLVFFVLMLVLLLPLVQLAYSLWGMPWDKTIPGVVGGLPPGSFLVGGTAFSSVPSFLWYAAQVIAPYFTLGGLLLALANDPLSTRGIHVTRSFGILTLLLLAFYLVVVVIWDMNRWIGGHVTVFDPTTGVWPLFHGQWVGALATNALVLALTFGITLIALIRSFTIQPDDNKVEQQAA